MEGARKNHFFVAFFRPTLPLTAQSIAAVFLFIPCCKKNNNASAPNVNTGQLGNLKGLAELYAVNHPRLKRSLVRLCGYLYTKSECAIYTAPSCVPLCSIQASLACIFSFQRSTEIRLLLLCLSQLAETQF